jgi:hypothetical protein
LQQLEDALVRFGWPLCRRGLNAGVGSCTPPLNRSCGYAEVCGDPFGGVAAVVQFSESFGFLLERFPSSRPTNFLLIHSPGRI